MSSGKVLIILPSSRFLKSDAGTTRLVGYHLRELAVPVKHLKEADYQIVIATPNGETPFVDPHSLSEVNEDERLFYEVLIQENTQLLLPRHLSQLSEEFLGTIDGLLIPGGYATFNDFYQESAFKSILRHMHKHGKPTAILGYGILALTCSGNTPEDFLYKDYQITCPNHQQDQWAREHLQNSPRFNTASLLEQLGAHVILSKHPEEGLVIEDRELITAENAISSKQLAKAFLSKLSNYQKRRTC